MDWRRLDFDWNHVRAFLATAELGSHSAAARALRVAQPTVGRQLAALEQQLGVTLFVRRGRGVAPTPTGLELVEHMRSMTDAATRIARVSAGQALSLEGLVTISASELDAVTLLAPLVPKLRAKHPGLELEFVVTNASVDLARREADLALRSFLPTEPQLVARRLRDGEARLYAAERYLRTLPRGPAALARATFIGFDRGDGFRKALAALGVTVPATAFTVTSTSQHLQWALVREGVGIGLMVSSVGDAEPGVRRVPGVPPVAVPLWLVSHRDVFTSRRVRAVADFLFEHLHEPPPATPPSHTWGRGRAGGQLRVRRTQA